MSLLNFKLVFVLMICVLIQFIPKPTGVLPEALLTYSISFTKIAQTVFDNSKNKQTRL